MGKQDEMAKEIKGWLEQRLPGFQVTYSGQAHLRNGHTEDLLYGYEFQLYRAPRNTAGIQAAGHYVRLHSQIIEEQTVEQIIRGLEGMGLINQLRNSNGLRLFISPDWSAQSEGK